MSDNNDTDTSMALEVLIDRRDRTVSLRTDRVLSTVRVPEHIDLDFVADQLAKGYRAGCGGDGIASVGTLLARARRLRRSDRPVRPLPHTEW